MIEQGAVHRRLGETDEAVRTTCFLIELELAKEPRHLGPADGAIVAFHPIPFGQWNGCEEPFGYPKFIRSSPSLKHARGKSFAPAEDPLIGRTQDDPEN
jgi:hypothetical protein